MDRHVPHDYTTSNVLAWTATQSANVEPSVEEDAGADADEPPDCHLLMSPISRHFKRAPVRRGSEHHESLLTRALQSHSDDEGSVQKARRRRSITSNFSMSSAADLTCDTGFTTPARTNSPSPRLPNVGFVPLAAHGSRVVMVAKTGDAKTSSPAGNVQPARDPAVQALEKKRCISFACAAKPKPDDKVLMPPPPKPLGPAVRPDEAPKRSCIKFACPSPLPARAAAPLPDVALSRTPVPQLSLPTGSSIQKSRSPSTVRSLRSSTSRRSSQSPVATRSKKWLTANSKDLQSECSRFHEFASDEPVEDDWILRDDPSSKPKITINDTLQKENAIRKLGKEAEEEADQEEEEENDDGNDDENEDELADEDDDGNADDDEEDEGSENEASGVNPKYGWDDDASDGYKTDNEVGFADSEEEDDGLVLWTAGGTANRSLSGATTVYRRPSIGDHSDSSDCSRRASGALRAKKRERRLAIRPGTPELPDSTDFVCGTLDEDRPLEEAYISHVAARKQGKLHLIPQDIDPSFPTSEPENDGEELYKKGYGESDDNVWLHGELEDIHHERDRAGRRKKTDNHSPKRIRSPPPKRRHSPAPKPRGRSPRRLFEQPSPRRPQSPPATGVSSRSPVASPVQLDEDIAFKSLAFRPGLTHTKSLPRAPIMFPNIKTARKSRTNTTTKQAHIRGAIDIVKGLEQKRQRRKEKFYQKYCSRARKEKEKGQVKRPLPGQGAERMREVGLIVAGKMGQGHFVLSV